MDHVIGLPDSDLARACREFVRVWAPRIRSMRLQIGKSVAAPTGETTSSSLVQSKRLAAFAIDQALLLAPGVKSFDLTFWSNHAARRDAHGQVCMTVSTAVEKTADAASAQALVAQALMPFAPVLALAYLGHSGAPAVTQHVSITR